MCMIQALHQRLLCGCNCSDGSCYRETGSPFQFILVCIYMLYLLYNIRVLPEEAAVRKISQQP